MKLGQRRLHSFLEVCISTGIGFGVAFTANILVLPMFGFRPSISENLHITLIFTVISVIRSYLVRRLFNWWHEQILHKLVRF